MKNLISIITYFTIQFFLVPIICGQDDISKHSQISKSITLKQQLIIGKDENGDPNHIFYKPRCVTRDEKGNIYLLDSGNYRIQVFDNEGKFRLSFGKKGEGPGEFLAMNIIKYLNDQKLYVIDNRLRRISIFEANGNFKHSFNTKGIYQDIIMLKNGNIVAANLQFREDHRPIHIFDQRGNLIDRFGTVEEPSPGYFEKTKSFPRLVSELSYAHSFHLAVDSTDNIYYSQSNPYNIKKYDSHGTFINSFGKKWDLDFNYYPNKKRIDGRIISGLPKILAAAGNISIFDNKYIFIQIIDAQDKKRWIDVYNLDGKYVTSYSFYFHNINLPKGGASYSNLNDKNFYYLIGAPNAWPFLTIYSHNLKEMLQNDNFYNQ